MPSIKELLRPIFLGLVSAERMNLRSYKLNTELVYKKRLESCKNKFAKTYARHYFSQTDEDGITLEILKRIGTSENPTFLELGVGDGLENNTLILLSLGWRGSWFGGERLAFENNNNGKLNFKQEWIDLSNAEKIYQDSLSSNNVSQHDLVSIDLDGNDIYIVDKILSLQGRPKIFICEYNANLPPNSKWKMKYNHGHRWEGDNYFGASLGAFNDLFTSHNYFLCACNPQTGSNAFFVRSEFRELFPDIPNSIEELYESPFYWVDNKFGHKVSPLFVKSLTEF